MSVTIYGLSDDLIEVDGELCEEFTYHTDDDAKGMLLAFSEGTVMRIRYDEHGVWRISEVTHGTNYVKNVQAPEGDEENYSDRATISGASRIRWVVLGTDLAVAKPTGSVGVAL